MLVQLRRVVYLLLLLQCCVCVVHASGGGAVSSQDNPSGIDDVEEEEEEELFLGSLANKVNRFNLRAVIYVSTLEAHKELCEKNVVAMPNAVDNAIKLIKEFGAMKQKPYDGNGGSEEKLLSEARDAAQKAQKAVEEAKTDANKTEYYITNYTEKVDDLRVWTESLSTDLTKYLERTGRDRDAYNDENGYQDSVDSGRQTVKNLTNAIEKAKVAVREVKELLKSQEKSLEEINEFLRREHDRHVKPPAEVQPTTATENHNGSSEKGNEQSMVAGQRETEGLQNNTHTDGVMEAGKNNTENARGRQDPEEKAGGNVNTSKGVQVHQDPEENVMGNVNTSNGTKITEAAERGDGVQNTNKNPQKPNETSTAAPGTVNTESSRVTSGSPSSASMHLNVSGLSDGSSSPALLHSPLLLLLLCVLGSILVC